MQKERRLEKIGEIYLNNQGCKLVIKEYQNSRNCTIEFEDGYIMKGVSYINIKMGKVKNPNYPSVYGVAYLGVGDYKLHKDAKITLYGKIWKGLLSRSYSKKVKEKNPAYKDVTMCKEWHNFQSFAKWMEENWKPEYMDSSWHIEKDILIKGNKIYSPETCCFVPQQINNLFLKNNILRGEYPIGVFKQKNRYITRISKNNVVSEIGSYRTVEEAFQAYKTAKEQHIKEVADKWKDLIDPRVYQALYKYQVEITD